MTVSYTCFIYTYVCVYAYTFSAPYKQRKNNFLCKLALNINLEKMEILIKINRYHMRKEKTKISEDMKNQLGICI